MPHSAPTQVGSGGGGGTPASTGASGPTTPATAGVSLSWADTNGAVFTYNVTSLSDLQRDNIPGPGTKAISNFFSACADQVIRAWLTTMTAQGNAYKIAIAMLTPTSPVPWKSLVTVPATGDYEYLQWLGQIYNATGQAASSWCNGPEVAAAWKTYQSHMTINLWQSIAHVAEAVGLAIGGAELLGGVTGSGAATGGSAAAGGTSAGSAAAGDTAAGTAAGSAAAGNVASGVGAAADNATDTYLSAANNIFSSLDTTIGQWAKSLDSFLQPIEDTLSSITTLISDVNDKLITPVVSLIKTTVTQYHDLVQGLHDDLTNGLEGIVAIPQTIDDALTSVSAQLSRSQQELGTLQTRNYQDILVPGLTQGIGGSVTQLGTLLAGAENPTEVNLPPLTPEYLAEFGTDEITKQIDAKVKALWSESGGMVKGLLGGLWMMAKSVAEYAALLEHQLRDIEHGANAQYRNEILGPNEATNLYSRGLLTEESWANEMAMNGIGPDRAQALLNLTQINFSAEQAVRMLARGIINSEDAQALAEENSFSPEQYQALTDLMQVIIDPPDVAAAYARGLITGDQFNRFMAAALVGPDLAQLIRQLEVDPLTGQTLIRAWSRIEAAAHGFVAATLNQAPPAEVLEQYAINQVAPGQAENDWRLHWRIPGVNWWIQAYFRGLRTRSEVEQAAAVENIPPEVIGDLIAVERELIPNWMVPDVLASGAFPRDQAMQMLEQLGYTPELSTVIVNYGLAKGKTSKATTAAGLTGITATTAKDLFNDGIISSAEYQGLLQSLGYGDEAAELTVQLAEYALDAAARKTEATSIINQVVAGVTTAADAQSQLYALGFTDAEVSGYMLTIEQKLTAQTKLPDRSDLDKMLAAGVIDTATWKATMGLLGYPANWVDAIYAITPHTNP